MIYIAFEGGLGNQMFQYTFVRYLEEKFNEPVEYDISKYKFEKNEIRAFELSFFNIDNDWVEAEPRKLRVMRYGWKYMLYLAVTFPYLKINNFTKRKKNKYVLAHTYQKIINHLGFYRVHFNEYDEPIKYSDKTKYIRGQWFYIDVVRQMDKVIRKELRVITPISEKNQSILEQIRNSNSVAVHIRRGDYVTLGLVICDISYYKRCMEKMATMVDNPVFFIFSDDIQWVKENLVTEYKTVFVDNNNPAPEDMRLMYSCDHFIMSNSTFSWWGAYLGDNPEKKVIIPEVWAVGSKRSLFVLDEWIPENAI